MTLLLVIGVAHADSIVQSNRVTTFGRIESMDQMEVTVTATYPSPVGVQKVKISRRDVIRIEFNATTFNPGGPPGIGALPPDKTGAVPAPVDRDYAVLNDGHHQPCDGATIDVQHTLHCGKDEFVRSRVLRILLAAK